MRHRTAVSAALWISLSLAALPTSIRAQSFGTAASSRLTLGACDAQMMTNASPLMERDNCVLVWPLTDGAMDLAFPIHLPSGALIERVEIRYWDPMAGEPFLGLFRVTPDGGTLELVSSLPLNPFNGGFNTTLFTLPGIGHEVDNDYSYQIITTLNRAGADYQGIVRFSILYRLQVSPAPATATFGDVPTTHPFYQFIEALAASGITGGCGGGNYCPNSPVNRGQMAVFLAKALGLHFPN